MSGDPLNKYTRRTHLVRVWQVPPAGATGAAGAAPGASGSGWWLDFEVLDAISFYRENGLEVVISCNTKKAVPYIVDDTGDGNAKTPSAADATRRSHMTTVGASGASGGASGASPSFDVEVIDAAAFRDQNNEEWLLVNPSAKSVPYDVTDGTGGSAENTTRRCHDEWKTPVKSDGTFGVPNTGVNAGASGATDDYLTVQRTDVMAFRGPNNEEIVISSPSSDFDEGDPPPLHGTGLQPGPRAQTYVWSPQGTYDVTSPNSPMPPANSDPHVYAFFPKKSSPFTKDAKIACGPLWWIRAVGGREILVIQTDDTLTIQNMSWDKSGTKTYNIGSSNTMYAANATNTNVTIDNPATSDMLNNAVIWGPTQKEFQGASGSSKQSICFINVGLCRQQTDDGITFSFQLLKSGTDVTPPAQQILYFVWPQGSWFDPPLPDAGNYNNAPLIGNAPNILGVYNPWYAQSPTTYPGIGSCYTGSTPLGGGLGFQSYTDAAIWANCLNTICDNTMAGQLAELQAQYQACLTWASDNGLDPTSYCCQPPCGTITLTTNDDAFGGTYSITAPNPSEETCITYKPFSITLPPPTGPGTTTGTVDLQLYSDETNFPLDSNLKLTNMKSKPVQEKSATWQDTVPMSDLIYLADINSDQKSQNVGKLELTKQGS